MLQTDRRNPPKIGGEDKTIQTDKQRDSTLQKLVVRIKRYKKKNAPFISKLVRMKRNKQTDATLGKLVVRIRCYIKTNR